MPNYTDLDLQSLIDLLVKHTGDYTKMLTYGTYPVEEFAQCKQALAEIHAAIELIQAQETHQIKLIVPQNEKSTK